MEVQPGKNPLALLRMPPFPAARPRARPTLRKRGSWTGPGLSRDEIGAVAAQIAEARVGGSFWKSACVDKQRSPGLLGVGGASARHDPWPRIEADAPIVAHVDDEIALLATAAGRPVLQPDDRRPYSHETLLHTLYDRLRAFDYFDPWTGQRVTVSRWIEILGEWRHIIDRNREIAVVCGIAGWKRPVVGKFLWAGETARFSKQPPKVRPPAEKAVAVWPSRVKCAAREQARASTGRLIQIEDGFIRSAGLGARLTPPLSIVVDHTGIYYDPRTPSDLEQILADAELGQELCARAAKLIDFVTRHGITKYAAASSTGVRLPAAGRKILVAGQVADDRSVRLGCATVTGPLDLLRRVREAEPDAFIVFKPHPDVVAGLRQGHLPATEAERYVDLILPHAPIDALLAEVDAVHVLSSLTGFEALLRGREVTTHGHPFYAGWGLTRDLAPPIGRRGRALTLEQLVAATLILYPRYLDPVTRLPCPPEILAHRLSTGSMPKPGLLQKLRTLQGYVHNARRASVKRQ
ncbi:MAG: hypothetical protein CVT77_01750 [Alphaproteobacteria bacterium HGW-Alphaproteobacteria-16]|nr:MAG: hypothetical protein CVT77_01750 [Alphaproteobacteria bacterium HGW-Alphaproteobacteria-16]